MVKLREVREYWEHRLPGLKHSQEEIGSKAFFDDIQKQRYTDAFKYKYLQKVAGFDEHRNESVLEVGVGLGTDLVQFAKNGSNVYGIDLASNAIRMTSLRFQQLGLERSLHQASFTNIPFVDNCFDVVYSFGVLHHSEGTQQGIDEIHRVLKPGGRSIIMLYHKGFAYYIRMLLRYGVFKGEFLRHNAQSILNRHSEEFSNSPLTKAYSKKEALRLFRQFEGVNTECYRIDDYIPLWGKRFSISRILLTRGAYRFSEDLLGWNLIIKANKHAKRSGG